MKSMRFKSSNLAALGLISNITNPPVVPCCDVSLAYILFFPKAEYICG